jgi:cell wall-associated NlpC family hydrolase
MPTAASKLNPSKLNDQKELMRDDIELASLKLFIHGKQHADIAHMIVTGSVERTIDGASTVTIECNDPDLELQRSGLISTHTDINIDGLYFRMASAERSGDMLTLIFEDREVSLLRQDSGFAKANRDTMTRAEFVHSLVREVNEVHIRFYSPQEHTTQPIAPDPTDTGAIDSSRGGGFAPGADVKVKGINASKAQKDNISTVLGVGAQMRVPTVAQEAAVETITVESSALNLKGGDRDSVGIFQQRNIPPWNKRNRRNVAQAAKTFFEQAMAYLELSRHRGFHVSSWTLAQAVQISAFPDRYRAVHTEAEATVELWQGGGDNLQGTGASGNSFLDSSAGSGAYEFTRGSLDQYGRITKETTWDAAHRLADEVQWRCFMVSGTMYFISDSYLMKSRPRMTFGVDYRSNGVDDMDFDYDRSKKNARVTITCEIRRWGAPPGSVVLLKDGLGPIAGRWLVQDIKRDLFSTQATIELIKSLPKLPEPPASGGEATADSTIVGPTSDMAQAIVQAAQKALSQKARYHYRQYRPMADSLFDAFAYNHTDCSAFATLCYKAGGAPDPNGFHYNGQGFTGSLWRRGTYIGKNNRDAQPADLAFYGTDLRRGHAITTHVGVYIGGGMMIDFGSNPIKKVPVNIRSDFLGFRRYLDAGNSGH